MGRSDRRGWRLRPLTLIVFALLLAITLVLTGIVRRVVDDQEERLLDQRTRELSSVLTSLISPIETTMQAIGGLAQLTGEDPALFDLATEGLRDALGETILLLRVEDDGARVVAGTPLEPGDTLPEDRAAAVERATESMATTGVLPGEGDERIVGFAIGGSATPEGTVVYTEFALDPSATTETTSGEPFADLDVALYAAEEPSDDQLLLLAGSGDVPAGSEVGMETFAVGQDTWSVTAQPRESLVGSAADASPWIVLAAGLAITLIGATLCEVLLRRQEYAVALVDERTAELEAAQAQLVRSERLAAIGGLASAVGHELRNPLGVISNAHYLLRTKLGADAGADVQRHLATAERETAAATLIVSDLLEFARARDPIPADVDLGDLIGEALEVAPPPRGVEVRNDVDGALVVRADRDQLRQVLLNLITNGYDAIGEHGSLAVDARRDHDEVHVVVDDSGTGIPDDTKDQIFEPFFTSKAKGIGLGLTVTRRIVEAHGGRLSVADRPGGGTRFELVLPAATNGEGER